MHLQALICQEKAFCEQFFICGKSFTLYVTNILIILYNFSLYPLLRDVHRRPVFSVYVDLKTPRPFVEDLSKYGDDGSSAAAAKEDHIYMDAMGFGMGCCCLQMTFQACNINEARVLYDHLTPLCPVMVRVVAARVVVYICVSRFVMVLDI